MADPLFRRTSHLAAHLASRRAFLGALASLGWPAGAAPAPASPAARAGSDADRPGERLAPWQPGGLDIHHLATGRGNATLVVLPDGGRFLIDAGATLDSLDVSAAPRPNASRRPGEWIARYAERQLLPTGRSGLDQLLVTHLHPDHLGEVDDSLPWSARGRYRLTGVTDVAERMEIGTLVDRAWPDYDGPIPPTAPFLANYLAFVRARAAGGGRVERFGVGRDDQFGGRPGSAPAQAFGVRNLAANGAVWSGEGTCSASRFPPADTLPPADLPNENMLSTAVLVHSGPFRYFTGGDLTSYTFDGAQPWRDVLGAAARVAGPVDVATADHHGMFDGLSAEVVRTLRPRAWVIPTWHIAHPDMLQLERMLSQRLYPGPREVYATDVMPANRLMNGRLMRQLRSVDGHVIVRVAPGGQSFTVVVTDPSDERDTIRSVDGPHRSSAA